MIDKKVLEKINNLKKEINNQRQFNTELFNSIPLPTREDPNNANAEPTLKLWRAGSKKLKQMIKELQTLELNNKEKDDKDNNTVFVNSFGYATHREITTETYKRQQRRLDKEIFNFIR